MDKPPFLYHGSCKGISGALTPRSQHGDINGPFPEGNRDVVFATHDANLAATYTLKTKHMLSAGEYGSRNFAIFRDYEGWKNELANAACNVYALPSASFTNTLSKTDGKPTIEWQSTVAVTPDHIIHHTPETVMHTGAQLFFIDPKISNEIWHYNPKESATYSFMNRITAKHDAGILPPSFSVMNIARELIDAGLMRHLNADTGIEPITLEKSPAGELIKEDIDWLKQQIAKSDPGRADGKPWAAALGPRTGWAASVVE